MEPRETVGRQVLPQPRLGTFAGFWGDGSFQPLLFSVARELGDASLHFQDFVSHCSTQREGFLS